MAQLYAGLTVIEILGVAIKKEIDAAKFYRDLAARIPNPIIQDRFLTLAKEERRHRALLQMEYKRLTGETKIPVPQGKYKQPESFDWDKASLEDALNYAIRAERDAQKLYAAAAKTSTDPRGKRMLDYLVEFEKGHERMLVGELNFYQKAPLWFEEREEMLHVGP